MSVETTSLTGRLETVADLMRQHQPFLDLSNALNSPAEKPVTVTGLAGSSESLVIRGLAEELRRPILVVTQLPDEANDLYDDLRFLMGRDRVGHYPSRQILPYDFRAPVGEILGKRISTLAGMLAGTTEVVVCPVRALLEPTIPVDQLEASRIELVRGEETDLDDLVRRLVRLGFRRVPLVEEVGDFAHRGGLIDFFTPGSEAPVRVELFGNEVDTIRQFEVSTQRTVGRLKRVGVLPKREVPITQETLEKYLEQMPEEDADYIRTRYLNDPELPGLEWLSILFGMETGSLTDYLGDQQIVYMQGQGALESESEAIFEEAANLRERLKNRLTRLPLPEEYYRSSEATFARLRQCPTVDRVPFRGGRSNILSFECQPHPSFASRLDLVAEQVREYETMGLTYFIAGDTAGQADRLADLITEKTDLTTRPAVEVANLRGGFVCQTAGCAILTDHEIFSRRHRRVRRKKFKEGVAISDYTSLTQHDFVVHTEFGIARYLGLETLTVDKRNRDCLLLQYANNDRLYVPIEEFNRVSKYAGKDSDPQLTHLGGPAWDKLKKKTKKAIADMAEDLLKLYAERQSQTGFSFGEDTVWLKQLEASFPYDETPDQDKAIGDVKSDMAEEKPMDRLVCGDVGFGKTEVAVRAAFKAIDGGKQVAVLVPTTVLAQQHFTTFKERFAEFPVRVELLSRFRTRLQQLQTVKDLAEGKVDLVIGTHRLFSKDVAFRDLGLLVVDEEHRFGVKHKENLRKLRATVDTLVMTATPIPRTMQMSLMGVRDMSLIATSPKDRLPIITEIVEFDPAVIATAILREIDRGGQVFFVHNRVQTIEAMHRYLQKILPQAQIAIAHGQMHERSLEGVMLAFMTGRFNVLLCTSIIESGLDIPNANTIIINRADRFGLAQLYQIRGRVGRSARRAYAYLLTPPIRLMRADAVKRLRALEAHSDLGSGFALAMRDLEIRGAGTILGARQSGFIEELGFDLYHKLLEEAVTKLKGQEIIELPETRLESDIETHLPDTYVNDPQHKVDIYRRLANSRTLDDVENIREEVVDRFGKPPQSATDLFEATAVKISASLLEIEKVTVRSGQVRMFFSEEHKLTRHEVESLRKGTDLPLEFSLIGHPRIDLDLAQINQHERLAYLRGLLGKV
ncbi:MAG: transcription-repair coupling factor [bacterium]|nr:transcription-repair coupling factor [bacterium]